MSQPIIYDGEQTKMRFWQEAALQAMSAYIIAKPPPPFENSATKAKYLRDCSNFAFDMAEQMHKNHGPGLNL